jgi:hypothetical protein
MYSLTERICSRPPDAPTGRAAQPRQRRAVAVGHRVDPQRQCVAVGQPPGRPQLLQRNAGVVHAGQAMGDRGDACRAAARARRWRRPVAGIASSTRAIAASMNTPVAGRRHRVRSDRRRAASRPQDRAAPCACAARIGPAGVAVDALQPDRPIREGRIQVCRRRGTRARASGSGPSRARAAMRRPADRRRRRAGARRPRPC